jgi:hypothetical protein
MLTYWKKTVESQWTSVREEWASEQERLASAREEWESEVRAVGGNLGATAVKFGAGLATLGVLQRGRQVFGFGIVGGSGETVKGGFHHHHTSSSGRGALSRLLVRGV